MSMTMTPQPNIVGLPRQPYVEMPGARRLIEGLVNAGIARARMEPEVDLSPHAIWELWRAKPCADYGFFHKDFERVVERLAKRFEKKIVLPDDFDLRASSGIIVPGTHQ